MTKSLLSASKKKKVSWTKRQLVEQAHSEIGLGSYAFNLQPAQLQDAMIKMDSMLGNWETSGIYLGYPIPETPLASDLDVDTTVDVRSNEAIYLNLAIKIAPSFGKQIAHETRVNAKQAYNKLLNRATIAPKLKYADGTLAGSGNKERVFLPDIEIPATRIKDEVDLT